MFVCAKISFNRFTGKTKKKESIPPQRNGFLCIITLNCISSDAVV